MALRAAHSFSLQTGISPGKTVASAFASLKLCRSDPQDPPLLEWEECIELFTVAMMIKHTISLTKLARTEGSKRVPVLMGGLAEEAASRNVISNPSLRLDKAHEKLYSKIFPLPKLQA